MPTIERIATIALTGAAGTHRTFQAVAAARNTPAGNSVVVTVTNTTGGATPPGVPDTFTLRYRRTDGTVIRTITLNPSSASQTDQFFFTDTGLTGGQMRSGSVLIDLQATRTSIGTYDVETDGSPNTPPTGFTTSTLDRGFIVGTTRATVKVSKDGGAGAATPLFAYPDTITARVVPEAPFFQNRTLTVVLGPVSAVSGSATTNLDVNLGQADNRFPAARTTYTPAITIPDDGVTGAPFVVFTTVTPTDADVNPVKTEIPLFQLDDDLFGNPPLSKDVANHRRRATQQGFHGSRFLNARGEGVNGLTFNVTLTPNRPGTPVTQAGQVTQTVQGEAGWGPTLLAWSSQLPAGTWTKAVAVTAPANATGAAYTVQTGSLDYFLVARRDYAVRVNVNHVAERALSHFQAGMEFTVVCYLLDMETQKRVDPALISRVQVAVTRAHPQDTNGLENRYQFLNSDVVNDGTEWTTWLGDATQILFDLAQSPADNRVYERRFTNTQAWGGRDFRVNVQMEAEGVIYQGELVVPNLGEQSDHGAKRWGLRLGPLVERA